MPIHYVELFGLEYVLILGAWYGVAVVLTVLAAIIRRSVACYGHLAGDNPAQVTMNRRTAS